MQETTLIDHKLTDKELYRNRRRAGKRGQGDKPALKKRAEAWSC